VLLQQGLSQSDLVKNFEDHNLTALPDAYKSILTWTKKYVQQPWSFCYDDLFSLRRVAGLTNEDILEMVVNCGWQTWAILYADAGGAEEAGFDPVLRSHSWYKETAGTIVGAFDVEPNISSLPEVPTQDEPVAWLPYDVPSAEFEAVCEQSEARYGFVPNLLRAASCNQRFLGIWLRGLELLERSQSGALSKAEHALVRAVTAALNRGTYSYATVAALLEMSGRPCQSIEALGTDPASAAWNERSKVVIDLAVKLTRSPFKVMEEDVRLFDAAGLSERAYIDVVGTVANQMALDRTAHALGIAEDPKPHLLRVLTS